MRWCVVRPSALYCSCAALLLVCAANSQADVILKTGGGKVVGTVLHDESTKEIVVIKSRAGKIRIPRTEIMDIKYADEPASETYADVVGRYKDTAEDQYALALWCLEHQQSKEYRKHLGRVIELDTNHAEARRRLGFRSIDGKWVTRDEQMRDQGYVKHNGKWVLPQVKELEEKNKEKRDNQREYAKKVNVWVKGFRQESTERRERARKELLELRDPEYVKPLIDYLWGVKRKEIRGSAEDRRLLAEVLDNIKGDESTSGLLLICISDPILPNRMRAVKAIVPRKSPQLTLELIKVLRDNDNDKVCRSAVVLGQIGDPSVYSALVDALITTHKHIIEPNLIEMAKNAGGYTNNGGRNMRTLPNGTPIPPDIPLGTSSSGDQGGTPGFGVGNSPQAKIIIETKRNQEALEALEKLTGENFGFSKDRWLGWVRKDSRARSEKAAKGDSASG